MYTIYNSSHDILSKYLLQLYSRINNWSTNILKKHIKPKNSALLISACHGKPAEHQDDCRDLYHPFYRMHHCILHQNCNRVKQQTRHNQRGERSARLYTADAVQFFLQLPYPAIQADQYIYTPNKKRANQQCAGNAHAAACNKPGIQFYKQAYQFGDCHHFEHSADFLIVLQT